MTFLRLAHRRRCSDIGFAIHDKKRRIIDIGDGKSGSFGTAGKNAKLVGVTPHKNYRTVRASSPRFSGRGTGGF
jgi:hypothetical protein